MLPLTPACCRSADLAVAGVASKEHKAQLEAEYHAGAAQGTAEGVVQYGAEGAATGAEYKVRLEAEFKARPKAEYKGQFEQFAVSFCLQVASRGLAASIDIAIAIDMYREKRRAGSDCCNCCMLVHMRWNTGIGAVN